MTGAKLVTATIGASASVGVLASGDPRVPPHWFDWLYPSLLVAGGLATALLVLRRRSRMQRAGAQAPRACVDAPRRRARRRVGARVRGCVRRALLARVDRAAAAALLGSAIFDGGQVVLPMLLTQVVGPGWVAETAFYAGMTLTESLPGPC